MEERKHLDAFEFAVLSEAKEYYGKKWRTYVLHGWMTANYNGFKGYSNLQAIRNDPTRDWEIGTVKLEEGRK